MEKIIYAINEGKRPGFKNIERKILWLNKMPILRKINIFKKIIYKIYRIPPSTHIDTDFHLSAPNLYLGNNVGLADTYILAYAPIKIGNNCTFSKGNMIITSTHDYEDFSTVIAKPITIGNNVWITLNVVILQGVVIGDNTIIGAGSVVTHDIPAGVLAAGNPCRVVKKIEFKK